MRTWKAERRMFAGKRSANIVGHVFRCSIWNHTGNEADSTYVGRGHNAAGGPIFLEWLKAESLIMPVQIVALLHTSRADSLAIYKPHGFESIESSVFRPLPTLTSREQRGENLVARSCGAGITVL